MIKDKKIRTSLNLHVDTTKENYHNRYSDQWTYKFRFSYDTINQPEESARLLKMFEDKELEMTLDVIADNPEERSESSLDNKMSDLNIGIDFGVEESKDED